MSLKRKDLEIFLEGLEQPQQQKIEYEQYITPTRVAANLIWIAGMQHDDIIDKIVVDLGAGSGILTLGAAYFGAKHVIAIDIDLSSLLVAKENSQTLKLRELCDFIQMDAEKSKLKQINTTIMNPPFGMRKESRSRDRSFIKTALTFSEVVYSIIPQAQKTRSFFQKFCSQHNARVDKIIPMDFEIKKQYNFHHKKQHVITVDLYRIISLRTA
ncbi:MAG: METTL5 family protein [Asgard group archaeon]|nr:METTL5 family protein [Asgard group archaeon]